MNIRINDQETALHGLFFRTADRMRVDGCVNALAQEGLSLALSSASEALLDHYVQILLQRLRGVAAQLEVEVYFPANTESLIARFNEVLARQSVREATRNQGESSGGQVWLVHDAHQLPDQELQLLARLIQNFPGANIRAILLMVGEAPSQETLSPFGRKLLRWDIESPSPEQIDAALETARHNGQADALELLLRRMGKRRAQTAAWLADEALAPAARNAEDEVTPVVGEAAPMPTVAPPRGARLQRMVTEAVAAFQKRRAVRLPGWASSAALRQRAPMLGVAAGALALSVLFMMWLQPAAFGLRGSQKAQTPATAAAKEAPAQPAPAPTSVTSVTTAQPAPPPIDVPDPAAEAQAWARSLPATGFVIQHASLATYEKAEQVIKSYASLSEARIVAAYRPGEQLAHFLVVSGGYDTAGKAYERIGRRDLPNTSWVRSTASLQQQLNAPAQAREKR